MNPKELPLVGPLQNANKDALKLFRPYMSIEKKRVLCVGYTEAELAELVVPYKPAEIMCLTNWTEHDDAKVTRYKLAIGDLCKRTPFEDRSFDVILQLSVLEHLHDVQGAFTEMRRLLRPNGYASVVFGPAWSSPFGHHLYADAQRPLMNFVSWRLPAHIHLLCSEEEITRWYLEQGYSQADATNVLYWFYTTDIINRMFYDDYTQLMSKHFQLIACDVMYHDLPTDHLLRLREKFPSQSDFGSYGGRYLLRGAG